MIELSLCSNAKFDTDFQHNAIVLSNLAFQHVSFLIEANKFARLDLYGKVLERKKTSSDTRHFLHPTRFSLRFLQPPHSTAETFSIGRNQLIPVT